MQVAPAILFREEVAGAFKLEVDFVGFCQVGRPAKQPGHILRQSVENFAGTFACCHAFGVARERGQIPVPALGKFTPLHPIEPVRQVGILLGIIREQVHPPAAELSATLTDARTKMLAHSLRNQKLGIFRPAVKLFHQPHFGFAQRLPVGLEAILLVGRAVTDMAVHDDQSWPVAGLQKYFVGSSAAYPDCSHRLTRVTFHP